MFNKAVVAAVLLSQYDQAAEAFRASHSGDNFGALQASMYALQINRGLTPDELRLLLEKRPVADYSMTLESYAKGNQELRRKMLGNT